MLLWVKFLVGKLGVHNMVRKVVRVTVVNVEECCRLTFCDEFAQKCRQKKKGKSK
jgi:hypothetical protein